MLNTDKLNVWYKQMLVGQLFRDIAGNISFQYDENWLSQGFAISQHQV